MRRVMTAGFVLALLPCCLACCCVGPSSTSTEPDESDLLIQAKGQVAAKHAIEPLLLSPSTADFNVTSSSRIADIRNGDKMIGRRWLVQGTLDAKNAFGVPVRHSWEVTLYRREDAKEIEAGAVQFDGHIIGEDPAYVDLLQAQRLEAVRAERVAEADRRTKEREVRKEFDQKQAKAKAARDAIEAKNRAEKKKAQDSNDADQALAFAKDLLAAGKPDKAAERLKKLVKDYPDTPAAKEAAELLKKLEK